MYARGLSTRDVEDAFRDATSELLISRSAVSEITDQLWADYQAFIARDLSGVPVRRRGVRVAAPARRERGTAGLQCIDSDGRKHLLHLAVGNLTHLYAVRDAPTLDAARAAADRFVNTNRRDYPAAVGCFTDDLDALLAIHRVPVRHRIRVRTTNLAERSFVEERRRTKVIPDSWTNERR
jgi:transposase-like protein